MRCITCIHDSHEPKKTESRGEESITPEARHRLYLQCRYPSNQYPAFLFHDKVLNSVQRKAFRKIIAGDSSHHINDQQYKEDFDGVKSIPCPCFLIHTTFTSVHCSSELCVHSSSKAKGFCVFHSQKVTRDAVRREIQFTCEGTKSGSRDLTHRN